MKVDFQTAQADVQRWLDAKKISEKKREALRSMSENMIDAIQEGKLIVEDDCTLTQVLDFPEGLSKTELKYKLRISPIMLEGPKRTVKGDDWQDNLTRTIMALTDCSVNDARKLDTSTDRAVAESIATFFL